MANKIFIPPAGCFAALHAKNMAQRRRAAGYLYTRLLYYCLYLALLQDPPLH